METWEDVKLTLVTGMASRGVSLPTASSLSQQLSSKERSRHQQLTQPELSWRGEQKRLQLCRLHNAENQYATWSSIPDWPAHGGDQWWCHAPCSEAEQTGDCRSCRTAVLQSRWCLKKNTTRAVHLFAHHEMKIKGLPVEVRTRSWEETVSPTSFNVRVPRAMQSNLGPLDERRTRDQSGDIFNYQMQQRTHRRRFGMNSGSSLWKHAESEITPWMINLLSSLGVRLFKVHYDGSRGALWLTRLESLFPKLRPTLVEISLIFFLILEGVLAMDRSS